MDVNENGKIRTKTGRLCKHLTFTLAYLGMEVSYACTFGKLGGWFSCFIKLAARIILIKVLSTWALHRPPLHH